MVTAVEPLNVKVAEFSDYLAIESAWWRLLDDQQRHDSRGPLSSLQTAYNLERVRRFLESRIRQGRIVVAYFNDELAGISTFAPDGFILDSPVKVWEISDVWVEPHARRKGIASALVNFCEHECLMRGASEVRLTVYSQNEAAMGLYESLGYCSNSFTLSRRISKD